VSPPSKSRKLVVPDFKTWEPEFRQRLQSEGKAGDAFTGLMRAGCSSENLLHLLYAYTVSPLLLFNERSRSRDTASNGLKAVAVRLDQASKQMQQVLDIEILGGQNFADLWRERLTVEMHAPNGARLDDKAFTDFLVSLPRTLQTHSSHLRWFNNQLRKTLSARQVQNSVYLAELVTYIKAVTGKSPSWTDVAYILSAARPVDWPPKDVEPTLLSKNFKSFTRRNTALYPEIQSAVSEYLSTCAQVPQGEQPPTLAAWHRARKVARRTPF
jgi:hypothetical protein